MSDVALAPGSYLLLEYDYVPDIVERRGPVRAAHLEHARVAKEQGRLRNAGAVGDPPTGALFVFDPGDEDGVVAHAEADPYTVARLVTGWQVRPWTVVV